MDGQTSDDSCLPSRVRLEGLIDEAHQVARNGGLIRITACGVGEPTVAAVRHDDDEGSIPGITLKARIACPTSVIVGVTMEQIKDGKGAGDAIGENHRRCGSAPKGLAGIMNGTKRQRLALSLPYITLSYSCASTILIFQP